MTRDKEMSSTKKDKGLGKPRFSSFFCKSLHCIREFSRFPKSHHEKTKGEDDNRAACIGATQIKQA